MVDNELMLMHIAEALLYHHPIRRWRMTIRSDRQCPTNHCSPVMAQHFHTHTQTHTDKKNSSADEFGIVISSAFHFVVPSRRPRLLLALVVHRARVHV